MILSRLKKSLGDLISLIVMVSYASLTLFRPLPSHLDWLNGWIIGALIFGQTTYVLLFLTKQVENDLRNGSNFFSIGGVWAVASAILVVMILGWITWQVAGFILATANVIYVLATVMPHNSRIEEVTIDEDCCM